MKGKIVCALLIPAAFGCRKPAKETLDFTHMGYGALNLFIYDVNQTDSNGKFLRRDTIGYFCSEFLIPQQSNQTFTDCRFLTTENGFYTLVNDKQYIECGGVIVADTFLFLHPPRSDCYKILEFCPMPRFEMNKVGNRWQWDLEIGGARFFIKDIYEVKDMDTFKSKYELVDTSLVSCAQGRLLCYHVIAKSYSRFGVGTADYYLNNEYGLVKYSLQPVNKVRFDFTLIQKTCDTNILKMNHDFMWRYAHYKAQGNPYGIKPSALR